MKITIAYTDGEKRAAGLLRRFAEHILDNVETSLSPHLIELRGEVVHKREDVVKKEVGGRND